MYCKSLLHYVSLQYAERYIMLCYIHPEDLKELSCFVKFHKQPNKDQEYTIAKVIILYVNYTIPLFQLS